jgi:rRNA maturation RNase YbeY
LKGNQEISIALVSDQEIKKFNRIYRRKNQVTDVLSFSQQDSCLKYPLKSGQYLGEIIIGYPQAKRQAKIAKNSLNQELKLLLTHGFLHLLGYNHQKSSQAKVMQRLEDKIIAGQGIISRR